MFIDNAYDNTPIDALENFVSSNKSKLRIAKRLAYLCRYAQKTNNEEMKTQLEEFVLKFVVFEVRANHVKKQSEKGFVYAKICSHYVTEFNVPIEAYGKIVNAYNKIRAHERYVLRKDKSNSNANSKEK